MNERPKFPDIDIINDRIENKLKPIENLSPLELEELLSKLFTQIAVDVCLDNFFDRNGKFKKDVIFDWDTVKKNLAGTISDSLSQDGFFLSEAFYEENAEVIEEKISREIQNMISGFIGKKIKERVTESTRYQELTSGLSEDQKTILKEYLNQFLEILVKLKGDRVSIQRELRDSLESLNGIGINQLLITSAIRIVFNEEELEKLYSLPGFTDSSEGSSFIDVDVLSQMIGGVEKLAEETVPLNPVLKPAQELQSANLSDLYENKKTPETNFLGFVFGPNYKEFLEEEIWSLKLFDNSIPGNTENIFVLSKKKNNDLEREAEAKVKERLNNLLFHYTKNNPGIVALIRGISPKNVTSSDTRFVTEQIIGEVVKILLDKTKVWLVDFLSQKGLSDKQKFFVLIFTVLESLVGKNNKFKKLLEKYYENLAKPKPDLDDQNLRKVMSLNEPERLLAVEEGVLQFLFEGDGTNFYLLNGKQKTKKGIVLGTFFDETEQKDSMLAGKNISLIKKMTRMVFDDFYLDKGYFKLLKRFLPSDKVIAWLGKRELTKILEIFQKRFVVMDLRDFDL